MRDLFFISIIQGLTEFLPVSSSAHLQVYSLLTHAGPLTRSWEVALHAGTLLAVLLYFWRDLLGMLGALVAWLHPDFRANAMRSPYMHLFFSLICGTIPVVIAGFILHKCHITFPYLKLMVINSIVFGALMCIADFFLLKNRRFVSLGDAWIIGFAQILALIPGVSRSGICLTTCRLLGMDRITATRFTFLLSIPTVLGAVTLISLDLIKEPATVPLTEMGIAVVITLFVGLMVIHGMLKFLERFSFVPFGIYRILFGSLLLWWGIF